MIREIVGTFLAAVFVLGIWSAFRHGQHHAAPVRPAHTVRHSR